MKITDIQPAAAIGGGTGHVRVLAFFDLELFDEVRLYGIKLLEGADGNRLVQAPSAAGGRRAATFARPLAERITALASEAHTEAVTANGTFKAA